MSNPRRLTVIIGLLAWFAGVHPALAGGAGQSAATQPAFSQPADLDGDADVDAADLEQFIACLGQAPPEPNCRRADLDADADVDKHDFARFQQCVTGSRLPSSCVALTAIPPRRKDAVSGSRFAAEVATLPLSAREQRVLAEVTAGNVPAFQRAFVPVTVAAELGSPPLRHTVTYRVMPDYLAIGSDADFVRMPITPRTAQAIADAFKCSLPTRKMVNDIYAAAACKLEPHPFSPATYRIETVEVFILGNTRIEGQRTSCGSPLGALIAGTKKDVVISARLAAAPNKVAIYGWHRPGGRAIQPLYLGHDINYVDYSHGSRLIDQDVIVDGRKMSLPDLLKEPVLCGLVSDEGPIADPRYH